MKKTVVIAFIILLSGVFVAATFAGKPKPKPKKKKEEVTATAPPDAEKLTWYSPTDGYAKAKKEKKILIVDAYTDWCYWCKVMDKETYTNADIITKMNKYFVAVKFNPENNGVHKINGQDLSSEAFLQMLNNGGRNSGYPTTFFWKALDDMSLVSAYPGYREPVGFNDILNTWINK